VLELDPVSTTDRLNALFDVIHESTPEGTGALHLGGDTVGGVVLLEDGRVCWAALPGTGRRLTDLVCEVAKVPRTDVESAYAECRRQGSAVGHVLVDRRLIQPHELRALLLRQTAETLVALADHVDDPVWVSHRGRGYRPQFTFPLPEVFASASAAGLAHDPARARGELDALVAGFGVGAAFEPDGLLPIAVAGIDDYDTLRALGDWVANSMFGWSPIGRPRFLTAETRRGGLISWTANDFVFGARFASGGGVGRVLAQLMRRS